MPRMVSSTGRGSFRFFAGGGDSWVILDGRLSAPAGTIQYPSLLDGYAKRPPWRVAGVDYPVGPSATVSLQDPNGMSISGVNVTKSNTNGGASVIGNYITVSGDNVVIDGWDFSLHGGWAVDVTGSNCTIQNCNFKQLTTAQVPVIFESGAASGTVKYCVFNGNNGALDISSFGGPLLKIIGGVGTHTVEYNYFYDAYGDAINWGASGITQTHICKYNLISNMGIASASHGDFLQTVGGAGPTYNATVNFNTWYQPALPAGGGTQGITLYDHVGSLVILNSPDVSYNTLVSPTFTGYTASTSGVEPWVTVEKTDVVGIGTVTNNYCDPRGNKSVNGVAGSFLVTNNGGGGQSGLVNQSGNINMTDGSGPTDIGGGSFRFN